MLKALPGADKAAEADGQRFVNRALELYRLHVTPNQRRFVTIAVSESDGLEVAVVYHIKQQTADRIAGVLRKAGVAATGTSGDEHAEKVLHEKEANLIAIGISNIGGPCPACEQYFDETPTGFANVYWDNRTWIYP